MNKHILVIDDEESIRYTFENFLSEEGYTVFVAADCDEGVAVLGEKEIDLMFVDIILPGGSGIDFLKTAKSIQPDVPVIMITGAPSIESAAESMRIGAFDYIVKPIRQDTLSRAVVIALKHKEVLEESRQCRLNFEAIFRSVNEGIITINKNMEVMEINEAAEAICEFERDQVIGKTLDGIMPCCEKSCLCALDETLQNRQQVNLNFVEWITSRGKQKVFSVKASPLISIGGQYSGAVMVVRDETRLVNLERRLQERQKIDSIVGRSEGIENVRTLIRDLADVPTTVLVTGESGTGKELVVDALHYCGERRNAPLVKLNCSALSENLLESELFGHVAGAFTGAVKDQIGRFQRANGGTIFLDEIGEISHRMQLRLLRVIENMEFERVGDSTPVKVDVRVVTATNRDLKERVSNGHFRQDLYYRLKVVEIPIPPLRERRNDIPLLVEHFRRIFNRKFDREIKGVSSEVEHLFFSHPWHGNVRELENTLEHAFVRSRYNVITADSLPPDFSIYTESSRLPSDLIAGDEAETIRLVLEHAGGNKTEAARMLGMSRRTIYRKIEKYDIGQADFQAGTGGPL